MKWNVYKETFSFDKLATLLKKTDECSEEYIAIMLVNSNMLSEGNISSDVPYVGHYIVLVDFDDLFSTFYYLNPSSANGRCK